MRCALVTGVQTCALPISSRDERGDPVRVRRDAYGRPIHFSEVPLDRPGVARDVGTGQGVVCRGQWRCTEEDDSAAHRGSAARYRADPDQWAVLPDSAWRLREGGPQPPPPTPPHRGPENR